MALTRLPGFTLDSTSSFTFANASVTANVTAGNIKTDNLLYANGSPWELGGSYANSNVAAYLPTYTGQMANALVAGTVYTNAQPNITSVGTLSSLTVSGLMTATGGGIKVGNLQDTSGTNTIQLTNSDILVTGNISAGAGGTGNVTATYFIGNGSQLTGLPASYSNANVAAYLPTFTGNSAAGNFIGNGYYLTSVNASNISGQVANTLIAGTVYTAAQPNITSVGTLADLSVSGNATITGNLTVGGNVNYINVDTLVIEDPIIEQGGGANGSPLTTNDGKDRGSLLHYYTTTPVDAFMGWDNSNAEFAFGSNVSISSEVVTFNTLGNVRASTFIGSLSGAATTAATVTTNAQPNITSVGTLASLSVTANITSGNINGGNAVVSNYFVGDGSLLTGLPASYANANVANYLPTYSGNFSPSNLVVSTSANLGAVGNVIITGGTSGQVLSTDGSGALSWSTMTAASITVDTFTGDGTTEEFTLSVTPANANVVTVNYNGATLLHDTYSLSGANIVFVEAPANGYDFDVTIVNAGTSGGSSGASRVQSTILGMVFGG